MTLEVSSAVQDYAKAIYSLERRGDGDAVSTNALAERLGVSAASASSMVKKLDGLGLVEHVPYRGVMLTGRGMKVALEVLRHHRLLERYLAEELGVPWDRVHDEAEVLEHVLSEELEELISAKLGHPTTDPHGDPIPTADLEIVEGATVSMETLEAGDTGRFVRISDADPEMLRYLGARGIAPGDRFEVLEKQPFGGPLFARFGMTEDVHPLGGRLAPGMRVEGGAGPRRRPRAGAARPPSSRHPPRCARGRAARCAAAWRCWAPPSSPASPTSTRATSPPTSPAGPSTATCCCGCCSGPT